MNNSTFSTTSSPNSLEADWWIFGHLIPIIIIVFGCLGNVFTFAILQNRNYRETSAGFYMKALAVSDNYVMVLLFFRWLSNLPNTPVPRDTYFCILYFFFARLGLSISAWILMCMTLDRYVSVRFPFKSRRFCTVKRAKLMTMIVVIIQIVGHVPYFWRRFNAKGRTLSEKCQYDLPMAFITVYEVIRMVVFDRFLPCICTLAFTIGITGQLKTLKMRNSTVSGVAQIRNIRFQVTVMSLCVAWIFNLLTFPSTIYESLRLFMKLSMPKFVYELFIFFLYVNSAVNCYVYMLVNSKFRNQFRRLILKCFTDQQEPSLSGIDNSACFLELSKRVANDRKDVTRTSPIRLTSPTAITKNDDH